MKNFSSRYYLSNKIIRYLFKVTLITAPNIKIIDEGGHELRDRYYKTGSGIELACIVRPSQSSANIPLPIWLKGGKSLPNYVDVYYTNGFILLLLFLKINYVIDNKKNEFSVQMMK